MNKNDDVTLNAVIVDITASGNPIIKLPSGITFLVKRSDVNTYTPKTIVGEDRKKRKMNTLYIELDDVIKILSQNNYLKDDECLQLIKNELEQKCHISESQDYINGYRHGWDKGRQKLVEAMIRETNV